MFIPFTAPVAVMAAASGTAASSGAASFLSLAPLLLVFVVFYFLMIRPQQRRMKTLQASIEAVKKGDQVVTAGGLVGKVLKVDDTYVELELGTNVRVKAIKATIGDIIPPGGNPAND
jgi:preprotein translocase subunit YajC